MNGDKKKRFNYGDFEYSNDIIEQGTEDALRRLRGGLRQEELTLDNILPQSNIPKPLFGDDEINRPPKIAEFREPGNGIEDITQATRETGILPDISPSNGDSPEISEFVMNLLRGGNEGFSPTDVPAIQESTQQPISLEEKGKEPNVIEQLLSFPRGVGEGLTVQLPEAIGGSSGILDQIISNLSGLPIGELSSAPPTSFGLGSPDETIEKRKERLSSTFNPEESPLREVSTDLLTYAYEKRKELSKDPPANQFLFDLGQGASTMITAFTAAIPATLIAGPVGGLVAGFGTAAMLEGGLAFSEAKQYGLTNSEAAGVGVIVGSINGALEMLPVTKLIKRLGIGKKIGSEITKMVTEKGLYKTLFKIGKEQAGIEAITEFAQELTSLTVESVYKNAEDTPELQEWLERSGYSALLGGILGFFAGAGAGKLGAGKDVQEDITGETLNIPNFTASIRGNTGPPVKSFSN